MVDGEIRLNEFGLTISEWRSGIQNHFPNVAPDEIVIMPNHRHEQNNPEGRWCRFSYDQIISRDKIRLDIFWLKDKSFVDLVGKIVENLEAGMNSFREIVAALV